MTPNYGIDSPESLTTGVPGDNANTEIWKPVENLSEQTKQGNLKVRVSVGVDPVVCLHHDKPKALVRNKLFNMH